MGIGLALMLAVGAAALSPAKAADDAWQKVLKRDFGTEDDAMKAIREEVESSAPDKRPALEVKLIAILESPEATGPAKGFACRMLRYVGSAKCVPAAAKLLTDEKLSHMARRALEGIADPSAEKALIDALGKTSGNVRVGIIETLGERRDPAAVAALAGLLKGDDVATVEGVLKAMGKIGTADAADAVSKAQDLQAAKGLWADTMLTCAKCLADAGQDDKAARLAQAIYDGKNPTATRTAALGMLVRSSKLKAMPLIVSALKSGDRSLSQAVAASMIQITGEEATAAFCGELANVPPAGQIVIINVLAARGDKTAAPDIVKMVSAGDQAVRAAAIAALGSVGDASAVKVLAGRLAAERPEADAARDALERIDGKGVTDAMIQAAQAGPAEASKAMLAILSTRKVEQAVPTAYKLAADASFGARAEAARLIGALGGAEDVAKLTGLLLAEKDGGMAGEYANALRSAAIRAKQADPVIAAVAKADDATKARLLEILGGVQGPQALATLKGQLGSTNLDVRKAAVSALKGWTSADPMADLLKIAQTDSDNACKVLALQGYISMIPRSGSEDKQIEACKTALDLASRPQEKMQILAVLGGIRKLEALDLAKKYLEDSAVKNEALAACGAIAIEIAGKHPDETKPVLEEVVKNSKDRRLVDRARKALGEAPAPKAKGKRKNNK